MTLAGYAVKPENLADTLPEAEALVAQAAGVDPRWVVFHWESLKSPIGSQDRLTLPDSQVPILVGDDIQSLSQVSDIFNNTEQLPKYAVVAYVQPPGKPFNQLIQKKISKAFLESLRMIAERSATL